MLRKLIFLPMLALFFMGAGLTARAQVTYSAHESKWPFTVGVGVSDFSDDWGYPHPRQEGLTLWVDWRLPHMPPRLQGLSLELEARDINYGAPADLTGHRMDTALAGPLYQWRRNSRIRPYAKYLIGFGSIDFPNGTYYSHDTRTVLEPGGGVDIRAWRSVSIRGEYDYQYWRQIFGPHDLTPNGFTIGAVYQFGLRSQ